MIWIAVVLVAGFGVWAIHTIGELVQEKKALQEKWDAAISACVAVVASTDPADDPTKTGHLLNNAIRLCRDVVDIERCGQLARERLFPPSHVGQGSEDVTPKETQPACVAPIRPEAAREASYFVVLMSYPAELFSLTTGVMEEKIRQIAGPFYSSTLGLKRELCWYNRTRTEARDMVSELTALKIEGSEVEYREVEGSV